MDLLHVIVGLASTLLFIYWYLTRSHGYWRKKNVPFVPDPLPGIGHMWPVLSLKENIAAFLQKIYNSTDASMIGFTFMLRPALMVRDPELIKSVFATNFSSFHNNMFTVSETLDPVLTKNPFFIRNLAQWKVARARAINHFSSKKLRDLFVIVSEVGKKMKSFIGRKVKESNDSFYECELKHLFARYTGEIVANAAFAMEGQSFEDNPHKLAFTNIAPTILEPSFLNGIKQALLFYLPGLPEFFRMSFLDKKAEAYFRENLKAIIKERKQSNIVQNDFLQFCIDANSEDNIDGIIADVIIFYLDSYETTSLACAYLFYNLSKNKEVQDKLRKHVKATLEPTKGLITYESLKAMNYFEQVLNESLRMMPPAGAQIKACTESITLVGSDGLECRLKPGDLVFISSIGVHKDPKFWPEPDVFDPERFSPENQASRAKCIFFPFGEGPRMCLGMRFAIIMIKLVTATLLTNFELEPSSKTKVPFEIDPTSIISVVKGGLHARLKKLS